MYITLVALVIGLVVALLFVNIYFRVKVMKFYRKLVKAKVAFDLSHIMNRKKMEQEVFPQFPESKDDIHHFVRHLKFSTRIGLIIFALISFFGWVLMHYR